MKSGRYEYHEIIGEGGMATVYRGTQKSLNRPVAIKVLAATLNDNELVKKRFKRESLIIARLNHPNIVNVIDKGMTSQGRPVFVMEFLEGKTLATLIAEGGLSFSKKVSIAVQLCKGLTYAHKLEVIHRDIKPSNIIVDDLGFLKILDFGIASFFESGQLQSEDEGIVMGTDAYMAPEQQQGLGHASKASDIYSLGLVLYELFAGSLPMYANTPLDQIEELPRELSALIMRCIEEHKGNRPASVDEVRTQLLQAVRGKHISDTQVSRAESGLGDKFILLDVLNENSLGATYLFQDKTSGRLLVIKKRYAKGSGLKEARLLGSLKHRNIATHYGASENENVFIEVLEYVSGGSLSDRLIEPFSAEMFFKIALEIARALEFAHQNGIIHGNLRPSNVLLDQSLNVKLVDFGFDDSELLRQEGRMHYTSPEKQRSELGDIFSLGAIYFHMLCAKPPEFKSGILVKPKILTQMNTRLQSLIQGMLTGAANDGPQTMAQVIQSLSDTADRMGIELDFSGEGSSGEQSINPEHTLVREKRSKRSTPRFIWLTLLGSLGLNVYFVVQHYQSELLGIWESIKHYIP
jgi:serine/threonine protein kinase